MHFFYFLFSTLLSSVWILLHPFSRRRLARRAVNIPQSRRIEGEGSQLMRCLVSRRHQSDGNPLNVNVEAAQATLAGLIETRKQEIGPCVNWETSTSVRTPATNRSLISDGLRGGGKTSWAHFGFLFKHKSEANGWTGGSLPDSSSLRPRVAALSSLVALELRAFPCAAFWFPFTPPKKLPKASQIAVTVFSGL